MIAATVPCKSQGRHHQIGHSWGGCGHGHQPVSPLLHAALTWQSDGGGCWHGSLSVVSSSHCFCGWTLGSTHAQTHPAKHHGCLVYTPLRSGLKQVHHCAMNNKKRGEELKIHNILNLVLETLKENNEAKYQNLNYRCVGPGGTKRVRTRPSLLLCVSAVLWCRTKVKWIPENNGKYLMI